MWRGSFPVRDEASARALALVAGVSVAGRPVAWPGREELVRDPILRAYGLLPSAPVEDEDSLAQTLVVGDELGRGGLDAMAARVAATMSGEDLDATIERGPKDAPRAGLELTSEGVLGLTELTEGDFIAIEDDDDGVDEVTVALSAQDSQALRSALGLPLVGKRMLRPAKIVGLPWAEPEEAAPPSVAELDDDAPELEAYTIDSLEMTLSESLEEYGFGSIEELQRAMDESTPGVDPSAK